MKKILTIMLAAIVAGGISAQNNNPKREVLFTLGENEVIHYNEYFMGMTVNGYKFATIIENTQTHEFRFVFNGKEIAKGEGIWHEDYNHNLDDRGVLMRYGADDSYEYLTPIHVFYLDPTKEDGHGYCLNIAGRIFTKLNNKLLPDIDVNVEPGYFSISPDGTFAYKRVSGNYVNVNGKNFGYYQDIKDVTVADNGKFTFKYKLSDKEYMNIDGKIFGPYQNVIDVAVAENRKFAFSYKEDYHKGYVNINGKIFGPYNDVRSVAIANDGTFAFGYRDNDKGYANINGKIFGPYTGRIGVAYVSVANNGKFAFRYWDNDENNGGYVNINGKTFGPYHSSYRIRVYISDDGTFAFAFEGDEYYNANGKNVSKDDFYTFMHNSEFELKDWYTFYDSGFNSSIFGLQNEIISSDGKHVFFSDVEYDYVVIDGDKVDARPAIHVYYDEQKHAFVWNAIEGKELVVYEYKL
jgi:hypothetical protein